MDWYSTIAHKGVERHGECLLWRGSLVTGGYGRVVRRQPNGRILARAAHRIVYEQWHGPIPEDFVVDHICHNRAAWRGECPGGKCQHRRCVNPSHLEAKLQASNIEASPLPRQVRTECVHRHAYDSENTGIDKRGVKWCKRCKKLRDAARYLRMKHGRYDDSASSSGAS